MSKKFTKEQLDEFEKARARIKQVSIDYAQPKKAKENDKKILAAYNASRANVKARKEDPEAFHKKHSEASKRAHADPKIKARYKKSIETRNANLTWKESVAKARKEEATSEEGRKRRSDNMKAFAQSEEGKKLIALKALTPRSHDKPLITEYGIFRRMGMAVDYFIKNNLTTRKNKVSVGHLIRARIIDDPLNYFYLSIEEYENCLQDMSFIDKLKAKPERKKLAKEAKVRLKLKSEQATANMQANGRLNGRPMKTRDGVFSSKRATADFYNLTVAQLSVKMKLYPDEYFYITKEEYERSNKKK